MSGTRDPAPAERPAPAITEMKRNYSLAGARSLISIDRWPLTQQHTNIQSLSQRTQKKQIQETSNDVLKETPT
jgi:hypothetical protein